MAQAYKEVTVWADAADAINHTYLLEGDKMLAYIRAGTEAEFWFSKPITISRSGRKFVEVKANPFTGKGGLIAPGLREVTGSKGEKYLVDDEAGTCTCQGYTFRGTCKHVTSKA